MTKEKFAKGEWHLRLIEDGKISIDSSRGMSLAVISNDCEAYEFNAHLMKTAPKMYYAIQAIIGAAKGESEYSLEDFDPHWHEELLAEARGEVGEVDLCRNKITTQFNEV